MGASSSTRSTRGTPAVKRRLRASVAAPGLRKTNQDAGAAAGRRQDVDDAAERFHQAFADREAHARARRALIGGARPMKQIEDLVPLVARNASTPIPDGQLEGARFAPAFDADFAAGGRVFRCVFQQVYEHLLDQRGIRVHQLVPFVHGHLDAPVTERSLEPLPCRAHNVPDVAPVAARSQRSVAETCHIEQVLDVTVQAIRFLDDALEQLALVRLGERAVEIHQGRGRAFDGDKGCPQIVRDRRQQRGTELVRLGEQARALHVRGELQLLEGRAGLIAHGVEQALLPGVERAPAVDRPDADDGEAPFHAEDR